MKKIIKFFSFFLLLISISAIGKTQTDYTGNSFVRQNGKIFPWGSIRILASELKTKDNPKDEEAGLWCWSEKLLPFGNGGYYAKLAGNQLNVFLKKTNRLMLTIPGKELIAYDLNVMFVSRYGYLDPLGSFGAEFKHPMLGADHFEMVKRATEGIRPPYIDNSEYIQLPSQFINQKVLMFNLGGSRMNHSKNDFRIFTLNGKPITDFDISSPLSKKKWGYANSKRIQTFNL